MVGKKERWKEKQTVRTVSAAGYVVFFCFFYQFQVKRNPEHYSKHDKKKTRVIINRLYTQGGAK